MYIVQCPIQPQLAMPVVAQILFFFCELQFWEPWPTYWCLFG